MQNWQKWGFRGPHVCNADIFHFLSLLKHDQNIWTERKTMNFPEINGSAHRAVDTSYVVTTELAEKNNFDLFSKCTTYERVLCISVCARASVRLPLWKLDETHTLFLINYGYPYPRPVVDTLSDAIVTDRIILGLDFICLWGGGAFWNILNRGHATQ